MGKIVLVRATNFTDLNRGVISQIDENYDGENILIVPDHFSLLAELEVFKYLKTDCVFKTQVMPISRLAHAFLNEIGIEPQTITSEEQKFLIKRAIQNTSEKFVCFSKNPSLSFCEEISKTIQQFKSCGIKSDEIVTEKNNSEFLKRKIHDLKLIFECYEELLCGKIDSNDLLSLFNENLEKIESLKSTRIYITAFDSLTNQTFEIVKELSKICPQLVIGALHPLTQSNFKLFDLDIFLKVKNEFKEFKTLDIESTLSENQNHICKNFYSKFSQAKENNNYLKIFEYESKSSEIDFVLKDIIAKTKSSKRKFCDFAIACSDLENYKNEIETKAKEYNLNYYLDTSEVLINSCLSQFVLNLFKINLENFSSEDLLRFLNSIFLNIDFITRAKLTNFFNKYLIEKENFLNFDSIFSFLDEDEIALFKNVFSNIFEINKKIKKCQTVLDFVNLTNEILTFFKCEETLLAQSKNLKDINEIKQQKLFIQLFPKFQNALNSIVKILGEEKCDLNQYYTILKNSLESYKISTVPISSNCVFIGDATNSFFGETKEIYIIGASGESLPKSIYDCGLISDDDIENIELKVKISPTIKLINKRNRFKLFQLLTYAQENLTICYPTLSEREGNLKQSNFVNDLCKLFVENNSEIKSVKVREMHFEGSENEIEQAKKLLFDCVNLQTAKEKLFREIKFKRANEKLSREVKSGNMKRSVLYSLFSALKKQNQISSEELKYFNFKNKIANLKNAKKVFFQKNSTSASALTEYFSCPFRNFVRYGLKLSENEIGKVSEKDIGNLLHYICENFVKNNGEKLILLEVNEIKNQIKELFEKIITEKSFLKFSLTEENKMIFKYLLFEATNLAIAIVNQQKKSKFMPVGVEKRFESKNFFEELNFDLTGVIDRIDTYKNKFRIIDYKSGMVKVNEKTVVIGKTIQPFLYARMVEKKMLKKCDGIFYLPIKTKFSDKFDFKLQGFFRHDLQTVLEMDNSLNFDSPKSEIISGAAISGAKKNKEKNIIELTDSSGINYLDEMIDYTVLLSTKALKEILDGNIECSPAEKTCDYCDYKCLCNFNVNAGNLERKFNFEIDKEIWTKIKN